MSEWKGRLGCYCLKCWEFCEEGTEEEWIQFYKEHFPKFWKKYLSKKETGEIVEKTE